LRTRSVKRTPSRCVLVAKSFLLKSSQVGSGRRARGSPEIRPAAQPSHRAFLPGGSGAPAWIVNIARFISPAYLCTAKATASSNSRPVLLMFSLAPKSWWVSRISGLSW
jgi:hypothetical protein